jgi:hypothetical protein
MGRQNATCFESALTTKDGLKFLDSTRSHLKNT